MQSIEPVVKERSSCESAMGPNLAGNETVIRGKFQYINFTSFLPGGYEVTFRDKLKLNSRLNRILV